MVTRLENQVRPKTSDPSEVFDDVPMYGGARARRLRRRRRLLIATAASLTLVLVAGAAFVLTQRNVTTVVTLEDAVEGFRERPAASTERVDAPESEPKADATADRGRVPQAAKTGPSADEAPKAATAAKAEPEAPRPFSLPAEGVYTYRSEGWESLSTFGARHEYPDKTYATVRHLGGCRWEHKQQVIEEHIDTRVLCGQPGWITQLDQRREIEFFGQRDGGSMGTCDPAFVLHKVGETKGSSSTIRCDDGEGTVTNAVRTFQGTERLAIGGVAVDALRVHIAATTTGRVQGTSTDTVWLAPGDGMTLRWNRTVDTVATAYGAKVRYQEEAKFVLESLEPKR